ncbi:hypothetical protein [Pseudonocardia sp. NPDC049154]|uniref:hypothetical protein n=1 Tax=Pseudonocardia sp. NPDC049154 TaxID=3155501 RepID=UPI0033D858C3
MSIATKVRAAARPRIPGPVLARAERIPPPRRRLVVIVALSVAVLALAGAALYAGVTSYRSHLADTARVEATTAAETAVAEVLSYAPQTIDADMNRARGNVTGDFATQFNGLLGSLVQPAVAQGLTTTTTASRAAVVDASPRQVQVLLYLQQRTEKPGAQPGSNASKALVTMSEVDGRWLISDLRTA